MSNNPITYCGKLMFKKELNQNMVKVKKELMDRNLREGWSLSKAKRMSGISDALHRKLYDSDEEYRKMIIAYFLVNRRGSRYFRETIMCPKKKKKYGLV